MAGGGGGHSGRSRAFPDDQPRPSRSIPADRAQGFRCVPLVVQQRGLELQRRQQAADPRRDDRARGPPGPGRHHTHVGHDRGQRVRLAQAPAPARLLRRQPGAQRGCPDWRLLRRRARLRGEGQVADGGRQLGRPRAQQLLADAVPEVGSRHGHQRGPPPLLQPLLPRGLGEAAVPAGKHSVLPRALPADAARSRRRQELRVPGGEGQGPLRRHRDVGRASGGGLVRRGRRLVLGRRRGQALDRGHGKRGLLQRRLGTARQRRPVLRRDGRRGHGTGVAHDGVPLAPRRSDPVPEVAEGRNRAQRLDVQRGRLGQVGIRRAHRPDVERGLLVPGRHRAGPAAGAIRIGASAAGQRPPDRGRELDAADRRGEGESLGLPGPLLVQGRRRL